MNAPPLPNKSLNEEIRKRQQETKEEREMSEFDFILYRIEKIMMNHHEMNSERLLAFTIIQNIIYKEKLNRKCSPN